MKGCMAARNEPAAVLLRTALFELTALRVPVAEREDYFASPFGDALSSQTGLVAMNLKPKHSKSVKYNDHNSWNHRA